MIAWGRLDLARRWTYRWIKYHLLTARPPALPGLLQHKTVVIVGSAPFSTRPAGWNADFRVVTVNASQVAARSWLDQRPDITLMQFNQIEGTNASALEVRRVLRGQSTGLLYMLHWRHDIQRLKRGLAAFDYAFDDLRLMGRYERIALMHAVLGRLNLEMDTETKWSNGIVAAALAVQSGAARVILTGINPHSSGHAYNDLTLGRAHAGPDLEALRILVGRGFPVFTADPEVARATALPLWTGG